MTPRDLLNQALAVTMAPRCAACDAPNPHPLDGAVCHACWSQVFRFADPVRALPDRPGDAPSLIAMAAVGPHDGALRLIVQALKYGARRSVAAPLSGLMHEAGAVLLTDADLVVPVPLHPWRQWTRGFNQAELLATHLGRPHARLLRRRRHTPPQVTLPAAERHRNVRDAFGLRARAGARYGTAAEPLRGLSIVLVDDVATTGATLEACARVLRAAGAARVTALTAARADLARPG
jgi:ComF family protein